MVAGERVYVDTTAAAGCLLGVGVSETADAAGLTEADGEFQREAMTLNPDYTPESVNTDGWESTQVAWKTLFPGITLMLCFLHMVLGIQQSCRREDQLFAQITDKLWHLYRSCDCRCFGQRLRRFLEWVDTQEVSDTVHKKIQKLRHKASVFKLTFDLPQAYRTPLSSRPLDKLSRPRSLCHAIFSWD